MNEGDDYATGEQIVLEITLSGIECRRHEEKEEWRKRMIKISDNIY